MNRILIVVAIIIITLTVLAFWMYGNAKYSEGQAEAKEECNQIVTKEALKVKKAFEKIQNETKKMSDPDIDTDLLDLGILRNDSDR